MLSKSLGSLINTGEPVSLKNNSILSPSNWDATSIKYLELKLISKSWSNFTFNVSFPSPLLVLFTDKFNLTKDTLNLSVNNANSGDGKEVLVVKFDHDLEISFNSRYLLDVASQLDGEKIEMFFNDSGSPALIKDPGDFDSIFVVMPMKG